MSNKIPNFVMNYKMPSGAAGTGIKLLIGAGVLLYAGSQSMFNGKSN